MANGSFNRSTMIKKIIKIVRIAFIILGMVLLTVVITIGRTNESLQPTLTIVVKGYIYFSMFLVVITSLLEYIYKEK